MVRQDSRAREAGLTGGARPNRDPVELLRRLSEATGPSGHEDEVRAIIKAEAASLVDEVRVDRMGSVIAHQRPPAAAARAPTGPPKVMLAAHMDEVGLMIASVEKGGLLRFRQVGGIDERLLVSKTVFVGDRKLPGVIGSKPVHLQERDEQNRPLKSDQLFIDIGAKSKEEAEKVVKVGDYAVFTTRFALVGERRVKGKALDDRVGCAVLLSALAALSEPAGSCPVDLYGAFTVQEEVGARGAAVAAFDIHPEYGVVLEGTICSDTPGTEPHGEATRLGEGPAVSIMDSSSIPNRAMVRTLVRLARENGIPYQYRRATSGGNDGGRIHLAHEGVPTCSLSVPCRYIHSPVSMASLDDLANATRLLVLFVKEIAKGGLTV